MRRLSMATRKELTSALAQRYNGATRIERSRILDEFVGLTGFHRKHAMRLLRGNGQALSRRVRRRVYEEAERNALMLLWEAGDRVCGKRLKALLPILLDSMERHGHIDLAPEIRAKLLSMSAATIDRALRPIREQSGRQRRRPAASALRRSIPVRTSADWDDPAPGFVEADLVAHSGPSTRGSFIQTLVLTDNDTVFMNETLKKYCEQAAIVFTRCRPYRKNDQAFVEQKNGAVVRRMVGYRRFEGFEAAALLAQLYSSARLFVNFFQPSFKLVGKERDGARVRKSYSAPATPHQRLIADARAPDAMRARVNEIYGSLDPVALLRDIRAIQERLARLTDAAPTSDPSAPPPIDQFLSSLRTAWKDGAGRPTDRPIVKAKRERRRPDPLVKVTPQLRQWFEAEPWRTGSELLSKLQAECPGTYPTN
ncbi:MAG: ISNCY family transposase, partial [Hyphomicrobiales bacterium]